MNPTEALREWPDADDSPAISHVPNAVPTPDGGISQRILDTYLSAHPAAQVAVVVGAFVLVTALAVALLHVLRKAAGKLAEVRTKSGKPTDEQRAANARHRAVRLTYAIGGFASSVSAIYTLYVFRDVPGHNLVIWAAFVAIAVLFELVVIMLAANALANALEAGAIGLEGALLGLASLAISYVTWTKQDHAALKPLAILPLAAGLAYYVTLRQAVRSYWAKQPADAQAAQGTVRPTNPIKVLWHRILVAMHLAAPATLSLSEQDKNRRVARFVWSSYRAEKARFGWQRWLAGLFLDRKMLALQERYPAAVYAQALQQVAALSQAQDRMRKAASAEVTVWDIQPELILDTAPASGSQGGSAGGSPSGNAGGNPGGSTGSNSGGSQGGSVGGNAGEARGSNPAPATEGRATCAEVMAVAQGWDSADLHARRSDSEVAHLFAVAEAAQVFGRAGKFTAAMRTYVLVMFAAGHLDLGSKAWNYQRIYREITGEAKRSTLPGQVARRIQAELAEDPAAAAGLSDELDELTRAGGSDA